MPHNQKNHRNVIGAEPRLLYAQLKQLDSIFDEIKTADLENTGRIDELLSYTGSWGKYYEFDLREQIHQYLSNDPSTADDIRLAGQTADPNVTLLKNLDQESVKKTFFSQTELEASIVSLAIAGNIQGLRIFESTVSQMVAQADSGDDEALFQAVFVDSAVLHAAPIARRVCRAQLTGDEAFFQKLTKAMTHIYPRRPKEAYDEMRFIFDVLDEIYGLSNISDKELCGIFIDELQLDPDDLEDPEGTFNKMFQARRKKSRK